MKPFEQPPLWSTAPTILAALDAPASSSTPAACCTRSWLGREVSQASLRSPPCRSRDADGEESSAVSDTEARDGGTPPRLATSVARRAGSTDQPIELFTTRSGERHSRSSSGVALVWAVVLPLVVGLVRSPWVSWLAGSHWNGSRTGHPGSTSVPSSRGTTGIGLRRCQPGWRAAWGVAVSSKSIIRCHTRVLTSRTRWTPCLDRDRTLAATSLGTLCYLGHRIGGSGTDRCPRGPDDARFTPSTLDSTRSSALDTRFDRIERTVRPHGGALTRSCAPRPSPRPQRNRVAGQSRLASTERSSRLRFLDDSGLAVPRSGSTARRSTAR